MAAVIRQPRAASRTPARSRKPDSDPAALAGAGAAGQPAGDGQQALQRAASAQREGLAVQQQAQSGDHGREHGQADRGGGDQDRIGPGGRGHDQQREDRHAQQGEDVPDSRHQGVEDELGGGQTPAGEHRPADAHGQGAACGQRVGHRIGSEVDRGCLAQLQPGKHCADGDPVGGHAGGGGGGDEQRCAARSSCGYWPRRCGRTRYAGWRTRRWPRSGWLRLRCGVILRPRRAGLRWPGQVPCATHAGRRPSHPGPGPPFPSGRRAALAHARRTRPGSSHDGEERTSGWQRRYRPRASGAPGHLAHADMAREDIDQPGIGRDKHSGRLPASSSKAGARPSG